MAWDQSTVEDGKLIAIKKEIVVFWDKIASLYDLFERIYNKKGSIIIPTYINMSKGTGKAAVKFITLLGADFKRQFDLASYKKFFEEKGYKDVQYCVVDGRMPCAIAVITKDNFPEARD